MKILHTAEVELEDLVDDIAHQSAIADIKQFILQLDRRIADADFTADLVKTLITDLKRDLSLEEIEQLLALRE